MAALTPPNLLGIPQDHYGLSGIKTGNLVHESIRLSKGLETRYDINSRKIVVLNSSNLPFTELLEILMNNHYNYVGWRPVVDHATNSSGNWEIRFACITSEMAQEIPGYGLDPMYLKVTINAVYQRTTMNTWMTPDSKENKESSNIERKESVKTKIATFFKKIFHR